MGFKVSTGKRMNEAAHGGGVSLDDRMGNMFIGAIRCTGVERSYSRCIRLYVGCVKLYVWFMLGIYFNVCVKDHRLSIRDRSTG